MLRTEQLIKSWNITSSISCLTLIFFGTTKISATQSYDVIESDVIYSVETVLYLKLYLW